MKSQEITSTTRAQVRACATVRSESIGSSVTAILEFKLRKIGSAVEQLLYVQAAVDDDDDEKKELGKTKREPN